MHLAEALHTHLHGNERGAAHIAPVVRCRGVSQPSKVDDRRDVILLSKKQKSHMVAGPQGL